MKLIKVAITGPESTGKSALAAALSAHFHTTFAGEYAREYLSRTNGLYDLQDMTRICEGQIELEESAMANANEFCFFDTDMPVLKVWSQYRFGLVPAAIEQAFMQRKYDLHLLCMTDLPWQPDAFRESPGQEERDLLYIIYRNLLIDGRRPFVEISGTGDIRFQQALKALSKTFVLNSR